MVKKKKQKKPVKILECCVKCECLCWLSVPQEKHFIFLSSQTNTFRNWKQSWFNILTVGFGLLNTLVGDNC